MADERAIVPIGRIEQRILLIRGQRVMLDADLAALYGVKTKVLNQAVKRNRERFPDDFMFRLTRRETNEVVTDCDHLSALRFSPVLPYAFTEHGAIMAASVLNAERAVKVSVYVVRAFVKLREVVATHKHLAHKLAELERRLDTHDGEIAALVEAIRELMTPPPEPKKGRIGFPIGPEG